MKNLIRGRTLYKVLKQVIYSNRPIEVRYLSRTVKEDVGNVWRALNILVEEELVIRDGTKYRSKYHLNKTHPGYEHYKALIVLEDKHQQPNYKFKKFRPSK